MLKPVIGVMVLCLILVGCTEIERLSPNVENDPDMLFEISHEEGALALTIDEQDVLDVIAELRQPENYRWINHVTRFFGESRSLERVNHQTVKGENVKIEVLDSSFNEIKSVILKDGSYYVIFPEISKYNFISDSSKFDKGSFQDIPEMQNILKIEREDISFVDIRKLGTENVIYFETKYDDMKISEKYWISIDFAVPLRVESYMDSKLFYLMETENYYEDNEISDDSFDLPQYVNAAP